MSNDYFGKVSALARKLDIGIEKLEDEWRVPQRFVGGYADVTEDTKARIELLKSSIQCTKDGVNELIRDTEASNLNAKAFIKEAQVMYDTLKQDIDGLEMVLKKSGHRYDKDSVNNSSKIEEMEIASNSNFSVEGDTTKEIIFTPYLSWRCKKKSIYEASLNGNDHLLEKSEILHELTDNIWDSKESLHLNYMKESAGTSNCSVQPQSRMLSKNAGKYSATRKPFSTPLRDRPPEPIYSKHFYNVLRKDIPK